ncbi:MAG TPA: hypothetical protein PKD32_05440 [Saprospiraceae bacterium]|nr:hypothetical protein [Saprospiraceae bacterium]
MPFSKKMSGNPIGKPKGAQNKITKEVKEYIKDFIENNLSSLQNDYNQLTPKERILVMEKLFKYVIPTQVENIEINKSLSENHLPVVVLGMTKEEALARINNPQNENS